MTPHSFLRHRRALPALALVALVVAACGDDSGGAVTDGGEVDLTKVTLTVGVETSSFGDLAAREASKAFEGTPYRLKWAEFDSTNLAVEALNARAIDAVLDASPEAALLAHGNADPAFTAATAPYAIVAVTQATERDRGAQVLVRPDSGIASVSDLEGRSLAFVAGTSTHFAWVSAMQRAGADPGKVRQVKMSSSDARAAFAAGEVDAVSTSYRQSLGVLAKGNAMALPDASGIAASYRAILVRRGVLDDRSVEAAMRDFVVRAAAAETWVRTNPAPVASIYAEKDQLDPDTAAKVAVAVRRKVVPIDAAVRDYFQAEAEVFLAAGVIDRVPDLDLVLDARFNPYLPE